MHGVALAAFAASRVGDWHWQWWLLADGVTAFKDVGTVAQAFASIVAGLIAVLGVPLALRQVVNLQRELRRYEMESRRRFDAETNLNISARFSLSHPARGPHPAGHASAHARRAEPAGVSEPPSPDAEPGKQVLRLDMTLENVGEGTVDVLACLVAARELERQGEGVISAGRDAQWDDLTAHYWDDDPTRSLSPGLSTTKHIVYAQDALARVKARSHKTLARIDQVREQGGGDIYLLYRVFVAARRSMRSTDDLQAWQRLQGALLNVNAPAFREAAQEHDPLGYAASADGWRLFVHHHQALADPKLALLRREADREEQSASDPDELARLRTRLDAGLREHCERVLLPAWRRFREDFDRMQHDGVGFAALLGNREFRRREREVEKSFPWSAQEVWTEYFYVTLQDEA